MTATARSRRASASRRFAAGLLATCSLAMLSGLVVARQSDRQQPMNFAAKHTDAYNAPNTVTTLQGQVKISQGTLLLTGDTAKIHLDADSQISDVIVTGQPAHIEQLDDSGNLMTGNAARLDYDSARGIAVLTGQAVVKQQGRGEFRGDKLTYNTETSQITGDSGGDGLVHGVFLPKPKPATTPAPASQPAAPSTSATPATAASSPAPQGHR